MLTKRAALFSPYFLNTVRAPREVFNAVVLCLPASFVRRFPFYGLARVPFPSFALPFITVFIGFPSPPFPLS